jgi:hypothetical protein
MNEYHPESWKDCPPLSEENSRLLDDYRHGIRESLLSDYAHTVEAREEPARGTIFRLPYPKYLKRMVFVNGSNRFQVAITLNAHLLDEEKAEVISEQESGGLSPVWPDGVSIFLLDNEAENLIIQRLQYDPQSGKGDLSSTKMGFARNYDPGYAYHGIEWGVYKLRTGLDEDTRITEDNLDRLGEYRVINSILQRGRLDKSADERFTELVEGDIAAKLLDRNMKVLINSAPYFNNILDRCIDRSVIESHFIWQQYWDNVSSK